MSLHTRNSFFRQFTATMALWFVGYLALMHPFLQTGQHRKIFTSAASQTVVQHKCANSSSGALTVTLTSPLGAGHMLLDWQASNAANNTPTMTGETFVHQAGASNNAGANIDLYTVNAAVGGNSTVTATNGGSGWTMCLVEISGQSGTPVDATGNGHSATYSVSTSGSTTNANDINVAFFYTASGATWAAGTGYTLLDNQASGGFGSITESENVSSTGVQTATATGASGTVTLSIISVH